MAFDKYVVFMCAFSYFGGGLCQLNLSEGSPCITNKVYRGTCVRLYRCGTAVLTYLYRNAGFVTDTRVPQLPDICSYKNNQPVVCCTDCLLSERDEYKDSVIAPHGILVSRRGPVAWKKCLDYFQKLPYHCHGKGEIQFNRTWNKDKQCHKATLRVNITLGGQRPQPWRYPHLATLGYGDSIRNAQWLCEGTVISERFILTAAHCTNAGVLGTVAYASLGLHRPIDSEQPWNIYKIKRLIIHPDYNEPSWYYDIALLETDINIRFDTDILPACLDVGIVDSYTVEGSGISTSRNNYSQTKELQSVYMDKLNPKECLKTYRSSNNLIYGYDFMTQMCYGIRNKTEDTCKSLSGSPLLKDQFKCQYIVVGVTGRPKECGKQRIPNIYTRIQYFVPWIEKIVWPAED